MNDFLPEKYIRSHDYCFFLHDQLVETLSSGEKAEVFNIVIQFKNDADHRKIEGKSGEELIQWLENNGYKKEVYLLYYKQICAALLSDFLHFIYEALQCSRKGKLTVAYALLRKPFKENLLYLEWLLADPGDFLSRFDSDDIQRLSLPGAAPPERKIEIIRQAMKKADYEYWIKPELIYQLRYDKTARFGLEPLWQKANHLRTTFKYLETEKANFNFVFSNMDTRETQWEQIYSFLPMLLFHTVQIVEALISGFAKRANADGDITGLRTIIGMLLWLEDGPWQSEAQELQEKVESLIESVQFNCARCGNQIIGDRENLELLYEKGALRCGKCAYLVDLIHVEPQQITPADADKPQH